MQYDKDQFIWEVTNEVVMLRHHATKEEREKLSIQSLAPMSPHFCIYGLMTGYCFSERASELILQSCMRYFKHGAIKFDTKVGNVLDMVNGTEVKNFTKKRITRHSLEVVHFSAVEVYILLPEAKKENLIAYLRGETKTLDLYF